MWVQIVGMHCLLKNFSVTLILILYVLRKHQGTKEGKQWKNMVSFLEEQVTIFNDELRHMDTWNNSRSFEDTFLFSGSHRCKVLDTGDDLNRKGELKRDFQREVSVEMVSESIQAVSRG